MDKCSMCLKMHNAFQLLRARWMGTGELLVSNLLKMEIINMPSEIVWTGEGKPA